MATFKLKFKDAKFVRGIFEAISALITETRLKINPESGLSMTAMDGSHICLVDLNLKKEDLSLFEAKENFELGLNLDDLVKIIKRGSSNDSITLFHDSKEKKLVIEMQAENSKKARKFSMALIDLDIDEIDLKQLDAMPFENTASFKIGILDEAIKDAEIFSEVLNIESSDKKPLSLWAEGTMGDMSYEIEAEELILSQFKENTEGSFAIQFLKNVLKISSLCDQVDIRLKSESPIHMKFNIGSLAENSSYIQYYLAPRVEEDSDSMYEED